MVYSFFLIKIQRHSTLFLHFSVLLSYEAGAVPFTPQLVGSILVESILLIVIKPKIQIVLQQVILVILRMKKLKFKKIKVQVLSNKNKLLKILRLHPMEVKTPL